MGTPGGFATLIALRAKQGELDALDNVTVGEQLRRVQPLVVIGADSSSPASLLQRIELVARAHHRLGRPIMVDASEAYRRTSFGAAGLLGELVDRLSGPRTLFDGDDPVPFVPVVRDNAADELATYTGRLCDETGIGAALRIHATTGVDRSNIARVIDRLGVDVRLLDIIVDLRYIDRFGSEHVERVLAVLDLVSDVGPARSVALLSGSVPATLKRTALWRQSRYEELVWREVIASGAEHVRFGDYGVVHPFPANGRRSKHVTIKYACTNGWIFGRERMTEDECVSDDEEVENSRAYTFRLVCRRLVDDENFAGPDFSWGDHRLAEAARGSGSGLGSTSKPIAFATSHHLAYLAGFGAAA